MLVKPGVGHNVEGEVFEVDGKTLKVLDRLEGHPHHYRRTVIDLLHSDVCARKLHLEALDSFSPLCRVGSLSLAVRSQQNIYIVLGVLSSLSWRTLNALDRLKGHPHHYRRTVIDLLHSDVCARKLHSDTLDSFFPSVSSGLSLSPCARSRMHVSCLPFSLRGTRPTTAAQ